jgi:hypothetical protein
MVIDCACLQMQCVVEGTSHSFRRVGHACHAGNVTEPQMLPNECVYTCRPFIRFGNPELIAAQVCSLLVLGSNSRYGSVILKIEGWYAK